MVIMANTKNCSPIKVGLYEIGDVIGEGNFATVRFARHRYTKSEVAIKIIDKTKLSKSDLDKVTREIEIMTLLSHPNIIKLYQVMRTENMLYLVTEYAPNGEIFDHIVKNGKLSEPDARKKFWQILSAIDYCHKNRVVHRDLKAENLLLDANGNIKIADFGFGNQFSDGDKLATFCGSPPYAAPELFEGKTYKGPEVDIWSLGVVLYVLVCGGLPFYGENLRDLKDRVVKGVFRIPYWMSQGCEHLIRRMLVRDPDKRYSVEQIKKHRWLLADGPLKPIKSFSPAYISPDHSAEEYYNEQVLQLMDKLGLERQKTIEQLKKNDVYDHYTAIYHLLLDRTRLHRSSYPLERQPDCRQQRRPSTVADNALSSHTKYLQQLHLTSQQAGLHYDAAEAESPSSGPLPPPYTSTIVHIDYNVPQGCAGHRPFTDLPSYAPSIDTTYSTSAESGLEVDMEMSDPSFLPQPRSGAGAQVKPPLARRHTLTGMTGIPTAESMLRHIGGPSIDSGNSMELPSESPSIESNLDYSDCNYTMDLCNSMNNSSITFHPPPPSLIISHEQSQHNGSLHNTNNGIYLDPYAAQRRQTRSPINFREGRRASDGLVCQDVIAFRQKLKDGMKAGGMLELRQEHNQLMESHSGEIDTTTPMEPPIKIPLGKRMSLPTSSIDLPPHRLLEIKKSIQLDQHLAVSQDIHDITHPFGPLHSYDPMQMHPFNNPLPHQRHLQRNIMRKQGFKQYSALHQQFQQMHIESAAALANMGRHNTVARQPSYKLAQQQPVMPAVTDIVAALPWEQTPENGNFLLEIANTCSLTGTSSASTSSNSVTTCISTTLSTVSADYQQSCPQPDTLNYIPHGVGLNGEQNSLYYSQ